MNHKHFINVRRMPSDAYDLQYILAQCFTEFFSHFRNTSFTINIYCYLDRSQVFNIIPA